MLQETLFGLATKSTERDLASSLRRKELQLSLGALVRYPSSTASFSQLTLLAGIGT